MSQTDRRRITSPTSRVVLQADVNQARKQSPGRQHHRARPELQTQLCHDADDVVAFQQEIVYRLLEQPQIGLILQPIPDRTLIQRTVRLSSSRANGRPLTGVEDPALDPGLIRSRGHGAAQRVDLFN